MSRKFVRNIYPIKRISISPMSPIAKAYVRIMSLATDRRFQNGDFIVGGPQTKKSYETEKRITAARRQEELRIIKEEGVIKEYVDPVLMEIKKFNLGLRYYRKKLKDLQAICKHPHKILEGSKKRCKDCNKLLK